MVESIDFGEAIKTVLRRYAALGQRRTDLAVVTVFDDVAGRYLLLHVGWLRGDRVHDIVVHLQVRDREVVVEWNGTEDLIEDLVDLGVPETAFVSAIRDRVA